MCAEPMPDASIKPATSAAISRNVYEAEERSPPIAAAGQAAALPQDESKGRRHGCQSGSQDDHGRPIVAEALRPAEQLRTQAGDQHDWRIGLISERLVRDIDATHRDAQNLVGENHDRSLCAATPPRPE